MENLYETFNGEFQLLISSGNSLKVVNIELLCNVCGSLIECSKIEQTHFLEQKMILTIVFDSILKESNFDQITGRNQLKLDSACDRKMLLFDWLQDKKPFLFMRLVPSFVVNQKHFNCTFS